MNQTVLKHFNSWGYQAFKYLIYAMLSFNVYLFFSEEWLASKVVFASGVNFENLIEGFSSTIDTAAWVVLLLLFELETYIIDDDKIKGATKWSMHGTRALCYLVIVYAFYGYLTKVGLLSHFQPSEITNLCNLASDWKIMETMNVYGQLTAQSCVTLTQAHSEFFAHNDLKVISDGGTLLDVKLLAWVDVINSGFWLLVVIMLEYDVRAQLGHFNHNFWKKYNLYIKSFIYLVLLLAAIFWGITGNFIEFWDAFLWLVAFFLIEMNMFEWQAETAQKKAD
ncbi:hypothetical protein AADZ86_13795 [Colwelliaceae bacterium BS250]